MSKDQLAKKNNNIWSDVLKEENLCETLNRIDLVKYNDEDSSSNKRGVESYDTSSPSCSFKSKSKQNNKRLKGSKNKLPFIPEKCFLNNDANSAHITHRYNAQNSLASCIRDQLVVYKDFKEIKDRLCECDDTSNAAYYNTLFNNIKTNSKYNSMPESITENFKLLISVFHMIDASGDGFISPEEFKKACTKIFNYLGVSYSEKEILEFIDVIDQNNDNKIDLQEFSNAFTVSITS